MIGIKSYGFNFIIVLFLICFGNNTAIGQSRIDSLAVEITGDTAIIIGQSTTLTATAGFKSYLWSTNDTTEVITVYPENDSLFWVEAISIDDSTSRDSIDITVRDYIIAHSDLNIIHEPNQPDSLWVELDEGATPHWSNDSTDNYIIVDPEENTTYTLSVIVEEETVQALIYNVKMANVIEFSYDTVCLGDSTTLFNTSITGDTISQILWDLNSNAFFDDAEGDTVKYKYEIGGNHLVGMRVYYTNGTIDAIYNAVPVGDVPIVDFDYSNLCLSSTTNFIDKSVINTGTIDTWYWDFGDDASSTEQNTTHLYQEATTFNVSLSVTTDLGCFSSTEKTIEIITIPGIELITADDIAVNENDTVTFNEGQEVTITVSNSNDYDSIVWYNDEKASSIVISEEGLISVNAFSDGCKTSMKFMTSWGNTPGPSGDKIMNLFTPNGDGVNDNWIVNDPLIISPAKVNVYNRSGRQVYANDNYDSSWDGQFNGNPLPQATYYYIIEDAAGNIYKGAVTIIR